jgi:wyosine [tRNA(Phe)-imidazoG37] synthetase (radical SAM superfamily)
MTRIVFGPVPSRRLGRSLGINHIPPKVCTYSCVYCQLGRTDQMRAQRQAFFKTTEIVSAVRDHLRMTRESRDPVDYLAFVPDGEPTLDVNLGRTIRALRVFGTPIAVITRPPAEPWARAPGEVVLTGAFEIFLERVPRVELLTGYEGDSFASTGDPRRDLLSITAVHPIREGAVRQMLAETGAGWEVVSELIAWGDLVEVSHGSHRYYLRAVAR